MNRNEQYTEGISFLEEVTQKLKNRIEKLDQSILAGQKDIESMHDYYWENYTEMDQYGYEDYDNQQALLNQTNANNELLLKRRRFRYERSFRGTVWNRRGDRRGKG